MSVCKGRVLFGSKLDQQPRNTCSDVIQKLCFVDSDMETSFHDISVDIDSDVSPGRLNDSSGFWDNSCTSPISGSLSTPCPGRIKARICSPIPFHFDEEDDDTDCLPPSPVPPTPLTPPHKKLRALRLYDTPHTPKSLLKKAQRRITRANRSKLLAADRDQSKNRSLVESNRPQANVNPFTPNHALVSSGIKRTRKNSDRSLLDDSGSEDLEEELYVCKKIALHEINTSRYNEEFYEVCKLGDGEFGSVYKCVNRLDGCTYAVKKSKTPVAGSVYERNAMNEVYAHAVLGKHQHVVRYYSAWAENDHMFIQNEYCNGGSLADLVMCDTQLHGHPTEEELKKVLLHTAQGLKYIHSQNLVHLDVKPGNIFVCRNVNMNNSPESGLEEDLCIEDDDNTEPITYKIGDLGHVTSITNPVVEEGDCRYLPQEILHEDFTHLAKADIFSLALTIFTVGGGGELPKNGAAWHAIRRGELPRLPHYSTELNKLLRSMVHPDPVMRPSAAAIIHSSVLCPYSAKSRAQLRRELNQEKFKNEMLSRQLREAQLLQSAIQESVVHLPAKPIIPEPETLGALGGRGRRIVGKKVNRSMSLTCF